MSDRVFLHVGSPKTGTTFLQQVLWSQRALARQQGLLLPLDSFFDHYLASLDVRGLSGQEPHPRRAVGIWDRVVAEAAAWPGTVLVSHELFAAATPEQARQAVAAFGDAEVHVVVTARDLVRQIPAEWQEHVKHRSSQAYSTFVRDIMRDSEGRSWFWRVQDVPDVLRRWGQALPRSRVHVVVVPPAGADPGMLWERFAGLLGLQPEAFDLEGSRSNTSLGAEQAELLRRVNAELGGRLPIPGPYPEIMKNVFAHQVLAGRPGARFGLTGQASDFAVLRSKEMAQAVADMGVHVVGDLAEMVPQHSDVLETTPATGAVGDPDSVSQDLLLQESVAALADVLDRLGKERARVRKLRSERDRLAEQRPVRYLLVRLSERSSWVMRLRRRYVRGRELARRWRGRLPGRSRDEK